MRNDYKFHPAMCFKPEDIVKYLDAAKLKNGKISNNKLNNELIASLVVHGVHKIILEWKNIELYFIPKDSKHKELIESIGTTVLHDDVPDFFKKNVEEDSEFDVIILDRTDPKMATYRPIQLKRFGIGTDPELITDKFIEFLDEKRVQYAKNRGSMYVFFENSGQLNFNPITTHLESINFPFEELSIFSFNERGNAIVCQLYPTSNQTVFLEIDRSIMFPGKIEKP